MRQVHTFELNLDALKVGVLSVSKTEPRIFLQRFGACRSSAPHAFCVYGLGVSFLAVRFSFGFLPTCSAVLSALSFACWSFENKDSLTIALFVTATLLMVGSIMVWWWVKHPRHIDVCLSQMQAGTKCLSSLCVAASQVRYRCHSNISPHAVHTGTEMDDISRASVERQV